MAFFIKKGMEIIMQEITKGYEPSDVLGFFEEISKIPRASRNEKAVAEYIYNWGKNLGLSAYIDEEYNVVLKKPASKGYENSAPVLLQGHLDIVPEKLPDSPHNFATDPLPLYIEDGKLKSKGTTLGGDNGNAIAYMMGVLSRNNFIHPPLECVFTTGEEIGLIGANHLDKNSFTAKRMINMDAGGLDQSITTVACAGGLEMKMRQTPNFIKSTGEFLKITIDGLQGGHSATTIHKGRGNAAKLMARMINNANLYTQINVCEFVGGDKMNAIISSCTAIIACEDRYEAIQAIATVGLDIQDELALTDSGFKFYLEEIEENDAPSKMLEYSQSKRFIQLLVTIPSTVRDMSFSIENHPLNSSNLGAVQLKDDEILLWTLSRSEVDSRMNAMGEELAALADIFGYEVEVGAYFGGWKYNPESKLRNTHKKLFREVFGIDLIEKATHGGLECGFFFAKEPEMDIITLGPKSDGAHTPEEFVVLDSFKETYEYLELLLTTLAKEG